MIATPSALPLDDSAHLRAKPATSWAAILAGAVVAIALSLVLVTLGAGLGFASVSPWSGHGLSASGFTVAGTLWLIVTQWLSAAAGGYLAGRLRHRWLATHRHEVFFRDTAHGLLTWAVATLFVAVLLIRSMTSLMEGGAHAAAGLASVGGEGAAAMMQPPVPGAHGPAGTDADASAGGGYNLDKLFRSASPTSSPDPGGQGLRADDSRGEVMQILGNAATHGSVGDEDKAYLANLVAGRTGVSTDEAQRRVDALIQSINAARDRAKAAADAARKSAATASLYTALALLMGAFIASVAAAIGGRLRDEHL